MVVWHPVTSEEFLQLQSNHYKDGNSLFLISAEHLGDEEEPMDLFIWGDGVTRTPMLRSAVTVNKELYWRA